MNALIKRTREGLSHSLIRVSGPARHIWPRTSDALLGTVSVIIVAIVILTYSPTVARHASQWFSGNKYVALVDGLSNPFRNRNLLLQSGLPIYDLKINAKAFAEIEAAVEKAKKQGWMSEDQKVEVNAKFYHGEKKYDVSVRIRGDLPPHWDGPKKSWQIKFGKMKLLDGDKVINEPIYFNGRRQLNLIIPKDRDFVVAPFANQLMREAGLTVPQDQYVVLRINGRMQGLYYEVEHFDPSLLALQRRPETTVFGQNDRAMHFEQYTKYGTPITADAKYDVGNLRLQVEEELALGRRSMEVLMEHSRNPTEENFRRARAVLDWDKYIRFRALTTLLNTNHVNFGSDNLKLYYDPSRGLLEPIPWDVHLTRMPKEPGTIDFWNSHGPGNLNRATIEDPHLRLQRNRILWEMVGGEEKSILARFNALHDRIRPLAWTDVLTTPIQGEKMDILKSDFEFNVHRVHKVLSHSAANLTYRLLNANQSSISVVALNFSGIRLNTLEFSLPGVISGTYQLYEDRNNNGNLDPDDALAAEVTADSGSIRFNLDQLILPNLKFNSEIMDGVRWEFFDTLSGRAEFLLVGKQTPENRQALEWTAPNISAVAVNPVTDLTIQSGLIHGETKLPANSIGIVAYDHSDFFDLESSQRNLQQFLAMYPQFVASAERPGAAELRGKVSIRETIVVPKSVMLVVQPGTDITMFPRTSLVCYGGLCANGTAEQPIHVHGDQRQDPWGVLGVVRPAESVVLQHVIFENASQAHVNGILFSGGVAIHEGDLRVEHCKFTNMKSEDALNLKNGALSMNGCLFSANAGDSCDLDFVTGTVARSRFIDSGNDGLDVSGTNVLVTDCRFERNGDKGCSVGEKSFPTIVNCLYLGNTIGTSCKDLSRAQISHCSYIKNRLGIEAIRKKEFFGGGAGEFANCVFAGNDTLISEDYFSRNGIQLLTSIVDEPTLFTTCRTATVRFVNDQAGDYRIATPDDSAISIPLSQPDWLQSVDIPASVHSPGIYNESTEAEELKTATFTSPENTNRAEHHASIHFSGRSRNSIEVARE